MIEIFCTGSACGTPSATSAWPSSWYATRSFSRGSSTRLFFSSDDAFDGLDEIGGRARVPAAAHREQCGLVDQVGQIGADHPGGHGGHRVEVDVGAEPDLLGVHREDRAPTELVRPIDEHVAIEAARAQERRVEDLGAVGRGHDDDAVARIEAVELDEQLVQRLLAVLVRVDPDAAHLAQRVELVDEDDARRLGLGLAKQVADARRANADEHLDELGAADREERDPGLAGDRTGEQGLSGAGRADEEAALGDAAAQAAEFRRRARSASPEHETA
jgi:hypothetical protein